MTEHTTRITAMRRPLTLTLCLLLLLLPAACAPRITPPAAATAVATVLPTSTAAQVQRAPAPASPPPTSSSRQVPATASGDFQLRNTSPDMPEVLVEAMTMVFEVQRDGSGAWERLAAPCTFDPASPVLVKQIQTVHYECRLQDGVPPGAELRTTVEIRLFGSDRIFRLEV